eukprot:TRINITY_DN28668_c0_g1_i1.p1 TRINITY_DN28668_c0_g1~~TRINITY_DN28668_c0_g1_i1.p1  ORF type:complete len:179 (+),score=37.67 TRINITY_DN28668_c0_g1_i1:134-670(+)
MKHFSYDFGNDGTFFMCFEDFVTWFNRVQVLRLMTDDSGDVWQKFEFNSAWDDHTSGGCTNHATWSANPQYVVQVSRPNTKVFMCLSQPDLRTLLKANPTRYTKQFEAIGVTVMTSADSRYRYGEIIITGSYAPSRIYNDSDDDDDYLLFILVGSSPISPRRRLPLLSLPPCGIVLSS